MDDENAQEVGMAVQREYFPWVSYEPLGVDAALGVEELPNGPAGTNLHGAAVLTRRPSTSAAAA